MFFQGYDPGALSGSELQHPSLVVPPRHTPLSCTSLLRQADPGYAGGVGRGGGGGLADPQKAKGFGVHIEFALNQVKVSKHVDAAGKIYLPYLHEWAHPQSDLVKSW